MKRQTEKVLKVLLCFALIVTILAQSTAPIAYAKPKDKKEKSEEAVEQEEAVDQEEITTLEDDSSEETTEPVILHELEENRGEFSKEYLLSDNSRMLIVYPDKIHFETENGVYTEIDNSLIKTESGYENGNNSYDVLITDNEESQGQVIYQEDGYEISWQMVELDSDEESLQAESEEETSDDVVNKKPKDKQEKHKDKNSDKKQEKGKQKKKIHKPKLTGKVTDVENESPFAGEYDEIHEVEQSKVVFDGFDNGVSIEYEPTGDGIKENIILSGKESGNEYIFEVKLLGLGVRLTDNNEIEFFEKETDEVKYYFPAPFMIDDSGEISYDAKYVLMDTKELHEEDGNEKSSEEDSEETTEDSSEETSEEDSEETTEDSSEETSEEDREEKTENGSEEASEEDSEETTENGSEKASEEDSEETTEDDTEEISEADSEELTEGSETSENIGLNSSLIGTKDLSEEEAATEQEESSEETTEGSSDVAKEEPSEETTEDSTDEAEEEPSEETAEDSTDEAEEDSSEESTEGTTGEEEGGNQETVIETTEEDAVYIKIVLNEEWLSEAAYPVIVDPVLKQGRVKNLLDYGSVASNNTLYETLYVGKNNGNVYRSFVKFELPEMESQSIISEALLYLAGTYDSSNKHYIQTNMATDAWYHKAVEKEGKLLSWNTQPGKGELLDYTVYAGYFNITKAIRKWQSGEAENNGIVFSAYNETSNKRDTIKLKNSGSSPYLKITYRSAVGLESYWGTHSTGAGTAGAGYVNDYTGALTVSNIAVATTGERFPLNISQVYNSNDTETGNGWRINYAQTIKIPIDTVDITSYPYVYTDGDGTEHYFKKSEVTYQENGESKTRSSYNSIPTAKDEDGLKLYIVPVTDSELRDKYPLKLINKSSSIVQYFDTMGRLAMITDSNQYEDGSNSSKKEKNAVIINYESYGNDSTYANFDDTIGKAQALYNVCCTSGMTTESSAYIDARNNLVNSLEELKKDVYVTSDYKTAKEVYAAITALSVLTDSSGTVGKDTAKTKAKSILTDLKEAKTRAVTLPKKGMGRIVSITDAVGNVASIKYDSKGRISSISDPSYADGRKNTYSYDENDNLTQIQFAGGKKAYYTYKENHILTSQRDHDGYQVKYTYRDADNRVIKVEESHSGTMGQTFSISYNTDNTTTYRFSGIDDVYGNNDDIENVYVFDEQGRAICVYSKKVSENKVIGATACTYENSTSGDGSENTDKRNKIKDTAVVGMHTNNLLVNHSFEYNDSKWTMYKNESETPASGALSARSSSRYYIGGYSAYVNLSKVKNCTSGFKQSVNLSAGTYTFSGYVRTVGIKNSSVYLKVKDTNGNVFTSDRIEQATDIEFDNGWQRLEVTFTVKNAQKVTVYLEADCVGVTGVGNAAFDCVQLESGNVANDYNILEDGSFELTQGTLPYQATNYTESSVEVEDEIVSGGVDGGKCYHITGQPGKDKFLKFKTKLGSQKGSFVLSGWVKADTTPIRSGRDFKVYAYHKEETDGVVTKELKLSHNINAYSDGWRYFCMIIPAESWKDTTFTLRFYDNIGDLYIDGLSLTRNNVQTKKYNSSGKVTSNYTTQKSTSYEYDGYGRTKKQTSPTGIVNTYTYSKTNEVTRITSNLGPDEYMTYDKYGNMISSSVYDPDSSTKPTMYTENAYTEDGNFEKSSKDSLGNVTTYEYDSYSGLLINTIYPKRSGKSDFIVNYEYDKEDRLVKVDKNGKIVEFEYGEFDDLTAIKHNGFEYRYTYDKFGNILSVSIAGQTAYTNEYAPNNGSLLKRNYSDGSYTTTVYDEYGRVTENGLNDVIVNKYVYNNDGAVARQTDILGNETSAFVYNDAGQVVRSEIYRGESTAAEDLESRMQFTYNASGQPTIISYQEPGEEVETYSFTYAKDGKTTKSVAPDGSYREWEYDSLRRPDKIIYTPKSGVSSGKKLYTTMSYKGATVTTADGESKKVTSPIIQNYTNKFGSGGTAVSSFEYIYDEWNHVTGIKDTVAKTSCTYEYNDYGEILKAVESYKNGEKKTYSYTYDLGGNILTETINGVKHTYKYDSVWKDKLISYDGKSITYDVCGQPLNYMGATCKWDVYGNLISYSKGNDKISYTYTSDGRRRSKTVNGMTTTYCYHNGLLISETTGNETIRYYYDNNATVLSIGYKKGNAAETKYFFTRNAHDDIVSIYRSSDSKLIGTYEYDLWGNPISITESTPGIDVDNILEKNPIRYRGYHYDEETGFYHLQSRYYDPVIRRFISADTVASIFVNIISPYGKNLFTYCENSPICYEDSTGQYYETPYDLITLEMSLCELAEDDTSLGAWINVILDVADVILPFATFPVGAGELCRMVRTTKRANTMIFAHTTLKYADEAVAVGNMVVKRTDDVIDAGRHGSKLVGDAIEGGLNLKYLDELNGFSKNRINHIINGSKGSNHGWEKLVPDKNWDDIKTIIAEVMETGVEGPYKTVYSKKAIINGFVVEVTYTKLSDGTIKISDAWIN